MIWGLVQQENMWVLKCHLQSKPIAWGRKACFKISLYVYSFLARVPFPHRIKRLFVASLIDSIYIQIDHYIALSKPKFGEGHNYGRTGKNTLAKATLLFWPPERVYIACRAKSPLIPKEPRCDLQMDTLSASGRMPQIKTFKTRLLRKENAERLQRRMPCWPQAMQLHILRDYRDRHRSCRKKTALSFSQN